MPISEPYPSEPTSQSGWMPFVTTRLELSDGTVWERSLGTGEQISDPVIAQQRVDQLANAVITVSVWATQNFYSEGRMTPTEEGV